MNLKHIHMFDNLIKCIQSLREKISFVILKCHLELLSNYLQLKCSCKN
jgi:hypothetical protein